MQYRLLMTALFVGVSTVAPLASADGGVQVQFYEPGKPYLINGILIPSQQTLSPASAPDLAFRPACTQLVAVPTNVEGFTSYGVQDPAGAGFIPLNNTIPTAMPIDQVYTFLGAEGNCKVSGIDVPILYKNQLPKALTPELQAQSQALQDSTATPASTSRELPIGLLLGLTLAGGGLALISFTLYRQSKKGARPSASTPQGVNPPKAQASTNESVLSQLNSLLKENGDQG